MYREEELTALKRQIGVRKVIFFGVTALLLAGVAYAILSRAALIRSEDVRLTQRLAGSRPLEIAAYILAGLAGIWVLTWWGLALKPLTDYRKLLEGVLHGRTHTVEGRWDGTDEDLSDVDGVECRTVNLILQDEKGWDYQRRFYLERHRELPEIDSGAQVRVTYHDKLLVSLEELQA